VQPSPDSIRVDKWLWAARVFKTRGLASTACDGGKVDINAEAAKPARRVRAGDRIEVSLPRGRRRILKVVAIGDRRGPTVAAGVRPLSSLTPRVPEPCRPEHGVRAASQ